jgi:hypothetical protein
MQQATLPKTIAVILSVLMLGSISAQAFSAAHTGAYTAHDFGKQDDGKGDDDTGDDDDAGE